VPATHAPRWLANALGDGLLWLGRQYDRLVGGIKADMKVRAAEAQLHRMTDRELADLGLCRADIAFAVREAAEGVIPQIDGVTGERRCGQPESASRSVKFSSVA
jgi:uncharacterized protein YjiS (DUF1127 family)